MIELLTAWYLLSLNIYHEAQGEPVYGQVAVGHVTLNRCYKRDQTVEQVVFAPYQFSWTIGLKDPKRKPIQDPKAFEWCMKIALFVADQQSKGETMKGIDHFFNPHTHMDIEYGLMPVSKWPKWAKDDRYHLEYKIANHWFYSGP